jgi:hypothetical protein
MSSPMHPPSTKHRIMVASALAGLFTVLLVLLVATYWRRYDLGTTGANGMALFMVVLPVGFIIGWALAFITYQYVTRRGGSFWRAIAITCAILLVVLAALLLLEVWRTAGLRADRVEMTRAFFVG